MAHFVLIHGICHGAWCWYMLVSLLQSTGHRVTPLDLGASGINLKQINELDSVSDYAQPLMEFMASLPRHEKVILVARSYGGVVISLAMESFPNKVSVALYLTAFMPNLHSPIATRDDNRAVLQKNFIGANMDSHLWFDDGPENPPTRTIFGPKYIAARVYQLPPKEDRELAIALSRRGKFFMKDLSNESLLTKENFGSANRVYIVRKYDLLIKESLQKWYIENSPTVDVKFIFGADHMAMLSKPHQLCKHLQEVAEKYA
ncbi:methylesterase 10-like [Hibiscus syriacus]|uniref:methylesterase 10-like n=1 Tax=Hibiscus syriacus TaxID=106335 RepID=UPI0019238C8A|nr:methylesterase 10-like [Hibiscus syriacus]